MFERNKPTMSWEEAQTVLGVAPDADPASLHQAYLVKVRQYPPDREPDMFEKVRNAYEQLKDPQVRARQVLVAPDPTRPLTALLDEMQTTAARRYVGAEPWLAVLKERKA